MIEERKLCSRCEEPREEEQYRKLKGGSRKAMCMPCEAELAKERYHFRMYGNMDLSNQWLRRAIK